MNGGDRREKGHVRIGVPPGVGDIYWALCKLGDFRAQHRIQRVTLVIKSSEYNRSHEWAGMCPFVDAAEYEDWKSELAVLKGEAYGVRPRRRPDGSVPLPIDFAMWPNAIVDAGGHLSTWLPRYKLDQDWKIATKKPTVWDESIELAGRPVVYASSSVINRTWAPKLGAWYWSLLLENLGKQFGKAPVLIGAEWDLMFRAGIKAECIDMTGTTTLPEVAWILEHAACVVGIICGMTILANHFRTPTIAIHPRKHSELFVRSWVPPGAPYLTYVSDQTPGPANVAEQALALAS